MKNQLVHSVRGSALFSPCALYRYRLTREVSESGGRVVFIMLNPSTADAAKDDPTVRRCMGFAYRWGFSLLTVVNLFAFRARDPKALQVVRDPIGPDNDRVIREVCGYADRIICAWSKHSTFRDRGEAVRAMLRRDGRLLHVLRLSREGIPCHPLYLRNDTMPKIW